MQVRVHQQRGRARSPARQSPATHLRRLLAHPPGPDGQVGGEPQDHVLVAAEAAGQPQSVFGDLAAEVLVVADAFGYGAGGRTCAAATGLWASS